MNRWIATLLIVALVGWVGVVSAQQAPPAAPPAGQAPAAPPAAAPAAAGEKTMEGKVKATDQAKKQITLEDGTVFDASTAVNVSWKELEPGKMVRIAYTEDGTKKNVKKVELKK